MKSLKIWTGLLCASLLLVGCSKANKDKPNKNEEKQYCGFMMTPPGSIPSAIMYEGKVYWETNEEDNTYDVPDLTKIVAHTKEDCFPHVDGVVSYAAKDLVGKFYFFTKDKVYVQMDASTKHFTYLDTMTLGEAVALTEKTEDAPTPDMFIPHFIYKGMMYVTHESTALDSLPTYFQSVGEVEERYALANKDFTGNIELGDKLFASDFQNRFMIVQSTQDNKYYIYEHLGYHELLAKDY